LKLFWEVLQWKVFQEREIFILQGTFVQKWKVEGKYSLETGEYL